MTWIIVVGWLTFMGGCTRPNPGVCCTTFDDCGKLGVDIQRPCSDGLVCVNFECTEPPPGCQSDADCSGATSHCATDGTCVECLNSSQCPAVAAHCAPDRTCVECLQSDQCSAATPVCDVADHTCRGCTTDVQCPSNACDLDQGTCVAEADVVYVSPTGIDTGACPATAPCSIVHGFAVTTGIRKTVILAPGSYTASLVISNKIVNVHGFGATVTSAGTPFQVDANATLRLLGVSIDVTNNTSPGVRCDSLTATLELDQVTIDANRMTVLADPGTVRISHSHLRAHEDVLPNIVAASPSQMTIDRSVVDRGDGVSVAGTGALIRITNSVISNQLGPEGAFLCRFFGAPAGAILVSFSTVVNSAVKCNDTVACGASPVGLCLDNSIIFNGTGGAPADTVTGPGCNATFTLVRPQVTGIAGNNNKIGVDPQLLDPMNGDFHLKDGSAAIDAANPAAANPIDLDGKARPSGLHSDLGAFEY